MGPILKLITLISFQIGLVLFRLHDPEMAIGAQTEKCAVHGRVEGLVTVAARNHVPVFLKDSCREVIGILSVPDAHTEIAAAQSLNQIVVVLQPLLLTQSQNMGQGRVPLVFRLLGRRGGAAAREKTGQKHCGQQPLKDPL